MVTKGVLMVMGDLVAFHCPGCDELHMLNIVPDTRPCWQFDGNYAAPTFAPSILVSGVRRLTEDEYLRVMAGEHIEPTPRICHSFVRGGRIEFLSDCTHALAGKAVPLTAKD